MAELERSDLDAWEVADLPSAFEDRVMAAMQREPVPVESGSRTTIWVALAAAVVLGVIAAALMRPADGGSDEPLVVALAGGAKAYPEPGAGLSVEAGVVEQDAGRVLYEVPTGTPLVVSTDAGDVSVHGTRFTVEVMEMNKSTKAKLSGAGALAMGTIAVAVYAHEGSVSLANEHGEVAVEAEQRAFATDETAPHNPAKPQKMAAAAKADKDRVERRHQRARRDEMRTQILRALEKRSIPTEPEDATDEEEEEVEKAGKLTKDYIRKVMKEQVVELVRECYNDALAKDEKLGGRIEMNFSIMGDEDVGGVIDEVKITEESTIMDPDMRECVAESMASAIFEPPEGGGIVNVTYPLVFEVDDEE